MKRVLLGIGLLFSVFATAGVPHDDDLRSCLWSNWHCRPVGRLWQWSKAAKKSVADCTAFLVGADIVLTAAHCVEFGVDGMKFALHYTAGKAFEVANVTSILMSGGGHGTDEELLGRDWAFVRVDKKLGELTFEGKPIGWFKLSNSSKNLKAETEVRVVSYLADWGKGEWSASQTAKIQYPPIEAQEKCRKVGKNDKGEAIYDCNFFYVEDYRHSNAGLDSGAPVLSLDGTVVGMIVGRGTVNGRVYPWATTVNESKDVAASVYTHWKALIDAKIPAGRYYLDGKRIDRDTFLAARKVALEGEEEKVLRVERLKERAAERERRYAAQLKQGERDAFRAMVLNTQKRARDMNYGVAQVNAISPDLDRYDAKYADYLRRYMESFHQQAEREENRRAEVARLQRETREAIDRIQQYVDREKAAAAARSTPASRPIDYRKMSEADLRALHAKDRLDLARDIQRRLAEIDREAVERVKRRLDR